MWMEQLFKWSENQTWSKKLDGFKLLDLFKKSIRNSNKKCQWYTLSMLVILIIQLHCNIDFIITKYEILFIFESLDFVINTQKILNHLGEVGWSATFLYFIHIVKRYYIFSN
jgi:hypothetical protein